MLASKLRKGHVIWIGGVWVEVTRREKWNKDTYRIHFKDMGYGLPVGGSPNGQYTYTLR